jgi:molybdenum cofactor biosynthesis enzyme MoaA
MSPSVEETAARFAEDVEFVRVDVSTDRRTATNHLVYGIPTLVAVRDDKILGRSVGFLAPEKVDEFFAGARDGDVAAVRLTAGERTVRFGVAAAIAAIGVVAVQPVVVVGALGFVAYAFADRLPRLRR